MNYEMRVILLDVFVIHCVEQSDGSPKNVLLTLILFQTFETFIYLRNTN